MQAAYRRSAMRLVAGVLAAAAIAAVVLAVVDRDPEPTASAAPHVAIAPGPSVKRADGKVAGTTMTAQQAADAAVEDGRHPDLVPLPESAFRAPIARYRRYAVGQARELIGAAGALRRATSRRAARRAWAQAFDRWLLVGAAYGALGDLDARLTAALDTLERDPLDEGAARSLAAAARKLPRAVRTAELAPADFAIRAHEILEDVQRDRLGDPAGVRATADGVIVTRKVISTLRGVLSGRGDALQLVDSRLATLSRTLAEIRARHGAWPAPEALGHAEHQRLLGRLGAALEALAAVPGALETSLPPKVPALR
jgi:high-affinity iron transporter